MKNIIACDIESRRVDRVRKDFASADLELCTAEPEDDRILQTQCDILSPNATGGVLNPSTIPNIKAKIICGGANNQLEGTRRGKKIIESLVAGRWFNG